MPNLHALILAGGSGRRFWPLSRDARPKQLMPLFDGSSLLEQTLRRLDGLVAPENTLILTGRDQVDGVAEVANGLLPRENILAEPTRRDTGPAIALGIGLAAARDPNAVMLVLPSDHLIRDADGFRATLADAAATALRDQRLVTLGLAPTWPSPSFGYIEQGAPAAALASGAVPHAVASFREKPSREVAEGFLARGGFFWNAGMFAWSLPVVRDELSRHAPDLAAFVDLVATAGSLTPECATAFAALDPRSIDYALMEKSPRVAMLPARFDWDDLGTWPSLANHLPADPDGNRANHPVVACDARDNIVFHEGRRAIALLGVSDLIVVETADALLVARREDAERVKDLTRLLPQHLL